MSIDDTVEGKPNNAREMREEIQILHLHLPIKEYNSVCKTMRDLTTTNPLQRKRDQEYILTSVKAVEEKYGKRIDTN